MLLFVAVCTRRWSLIAFATSHHQCVCTRLLYGQTSCLIDNLAGMPGHDHEALSMHASLPAAPSVSVTLLFPLLVSVLEHCCRLRLRRKKTSTG